RMRFAALAVQEQRDRYAPVALAGNAPVRAVGEHGVQTRLAPRRVKGGGFDGLQRQLAQRRAFVALRRFVHADEPLRGRAVDHRRFVTPAVHVAVAGLVRVEQAADFFELLDDLRVGVPDRQAAEEFETLGVT